MSGARRSASRGPRTAWALCALAVALIARSAGAVPTEVALPKDVQPLPVEDVLALTPEMREWVHAQVPATMTPTARLDTMTRVEVTLGGFVPAGKSSVSALVRWRYAADEPGQEALSFHTKCGSSPADQNPMSAE